jgi:ring-1,2-phenylacetyl-CoA epoxidase subunit PaaD
MTTSTSVEAAWAALETLADPEIPVISLRELGILREVRSGADGLEVVITPTYSGCPAMGQIEDDVRSTLKNRGKPFRGTWPGFGLFALWDNATGSYTG